MTAQLSELLCRVCLKQDELLVDIYEHVEEQQTDLCTLLQRCGNINVEKTDNYPKYLCQVCTHELLISAKFRDKCAATEQALKQQCLQRLEDEEAALAITDLAREELVIMTANVECKFNTDDLIEFDPIENVDPYEESETTVLEAESKKSTEALEQNVELDVMVIPEAKQLKTDFKCDECGAAFRQTTMLQRHIAKLHPTANCCKCDDCGYCCTQQIHLQQHKCSGLKKSALHKDERSRRRCGYCCVYCSKCLKSAASLVMHLRTHTGERPFSCNVCPKTFKTNGGLELHQKRHKKLIAFECEYCGKGFLESSNLKRHIISRHTRYKPHTCTICQRSFARVNELEVHRRTHTGERPYACTMCDRRFAQQGVLRSHELIHSGKRRHCCNLCQKTFSRSSQLKKHQLKSCLSLDTETQIEVVLES